MKNIANTRFLDALKLNKLDRPPLWIMRQAGRYLPEYRQVRAEAGSFIQLMKNPELASEVTLQPLRRFNLDAAIIFSDILTIPDALQCGLRFSPGEGPIIDKPIRHDDDLKKLPNIDIETETAYLFEAIKQTLVGLDGRCPLIGFAGSPWTLATYMVEGSSSKQYAVIKKMLYARPDLLKGLLEKITGLLIDYCCLQIQAGVSAIMVFDSWGGVLGPEDYLEFSLSYMEKIVSGIKLKHPSTPVILFTKSPNLPFEAMINTGCQGLGLDWTSDIDKAFKAVNGRVALQGNLDPCVLYASPEVIQQKATELLKKVGGRAGHIFNLGHGIHPTIPVENVEALVEVVTNFSL